MKHVFNPCHLLIAVLGLVLSLVPARATASQEIVLLVVEAARDTTAGFRAQVLPEQGRRALTWPAGVITLPDSAAWLEHGELGLAFHLQAETLVGVGSEGRFIGDDGTYRIDTPLYLGDTALVACLADGEIVVRGDTMIYRPPSRRRDTRGDLLLIGGLILATAVLLRSARRRTRRS